VPKRAKKNDKEIRCPRNPIFCKNRISQPCPNVQKKMTKKSAAQEIFKNRISQTLPKRAQKMTKKSATQEIRFFAKIGFLNRAQTCKKK
jgi:hypothetical protein